MAKAALNWNAFRLTKRELEIVFAMVSGDSDRVIARKFSMSVNTLRLRLKDVFGKLGVQNRLELFLYATYHDIGRSKCYQADLGIPRGTQVLQKREFTLHSHPH